MSEPSRIPKLLRRLGFGLSCLIENQIGRFFARKLVFAGAREIHAGNGLVDAIAGFPAIQILKAETLLDQLDGSFTADFQNGVYDFVGAGHIGIAVLLGRKIPVGLFVEILMVRAGIPTRLRISLTVIFRSSGESDPSSALASA